MMQDKNYSAEELAELSISKKCIIIIPYDKDFIFNIIDGLYTLYNFGSLYIKNPNFVYFKGENKEGSIFRIKMEKPSAEYIQDLKDRLEIAKKKTIKLKKTFHKTQAFKEFKIVQDMRNNKKNIKKLKILKEKYEEVDLKLFKLRDIF